MADLLTGIITFFTTALKWCLDGMLWLLKSILYLIFDGLLTVITTFFNAIDFSVFISSLALDWAGLPSALIYVVNSTSIPQCLTIISGAITIRLIINLIPSTFTRV